MIGQRGDRGWASFGVGVTGFGCGDRVEEGIVVPSGAHDVAARPGRRSGSGFARGDRLVDGCRSDPAMPLSEPIDIVGDAGGAGLNASVAIVGVSTPDAPRLRTNK